MLFQTTEARAAQKTGVFTAAGVDNRPPTQTIQPVKP